MLSVHELLLTMLTMAAVTNSDLVHYLLKARCFSLATRSW